MIKQVYDNRIDEILDNLKNRIINEKDLVNENLDSLVDNYVKMANIQIRTLEVAQKRDFEILKKLEKDLKYYQGIENEFAFLNNQSKAREENKVIIKYLENFLREVNNGIY